MEQIQTLPITQVRQDVVGQILAHIGPIALDPIAMAMGTVDTVLGPVNVVYKVLHLLKHSVFDSFESRLRKHLALHAAFEGMSALVESAYGV